MHQRIKGTLGITGLFLKRVHIDLGLGYIDVVLFRPYAAKGIEGLTVRQLKEYMRWV